KGSIACRVMLNAVGRYDLAGSYREDLIPLAILTLPTVVIGLWNLFRVLLRTVHPATHPVAQRVARTGDFETAAANLDRELQTASRLGDVAMTQSWLLRRRWFGVQVIWLDDLVWAHGKEKCHERNRVKICTGYRAILYEVSGKRWDWPLTIAEGPAF